MRQAFLAAILLVWSAHLNAQEITIEGSPPCSKSDRIIRGVGIQLADGLAGEEGTFVVNTTPHGSARNALILPGDRIEQIETTKVSTAAEAVEAIRAVPDGKLFLVFHRRPYSGAPLMVKSIAKGEIPLMAYSLHRYAIGEKVFPIDGNRDPVELHEHLTISGTVADLGETKGYNLTMQLRNTGDVDLLISGPPVVHAAEEWPSRNPSFKWSLWQTPLGDEPSEPLLTWRSEYTTLSAHETRTYAIRLCETPILGARRFAAGLTPEELAENEIIAAFF